MSSCLKNSELSPAVRWELLLSSICGWLLSPGRPCRGCSMSLVQPWCHCFHSSPSPSGCYNATAVTLLSLKCMFLCTKSEIYTLNVRLDAHIHCSISFFTPLASCFFEKKIMKELFWFHPEELKNVTSLQSTGQLLPAAFISTNF